MGFKARRPAGKQQRRVTATRWVKDVWPVIKPRIEALYQQGVIRAGGL
jgi:hypothetical protein